MANERHNRPAIIPLGDARRARRQRGPGALLPADTHLPIREPDRKFLLRCLNTDRGDDFSCPALISKTAVPFFNDRVEMVKYDPANFAPQSRSQSLTLHQQDLAPQVSDMGLQISPRSCVFGFTFLHLPRLDGPRKFAFSLVTGLAKSLKILFDCLASSYPSNDMIDVQDKAGVK